MTLPPGPMPLHGDPVRLVQVLVNLLLNASRYTGEGGSIAVETARDGDEWVLRVRDTGVGLEPDLLPRLFEPFARGRGELVQQAGGLGVGLALVRQLTELHGGSVEAHSEGPGRGSEFVVRLPVPEEEIQTVEAAPCGSPPAPGRRVLVVDDNQDAAETLSDLLGLWGYEVRTACSGEAGMLLSAEFRPDIAILDLGLPGIDGCETGRLLAGQNGHAPVLIALSGYGQAEDRERTRAAGFRFHLLKPVEPERLRDLLESLH